MAVIDGKNCLYVDNLLEIHLIGFGYLKLELHSRLWAYTRLTAEQKILANIAVNMLLNLQKLMSAYG